MEPEQMNEQYREKRFPQGSVLIRSNEKTRKSSKVLLVLVALLGVALERLGELRLCLPVSLGLIAVSWAYLYFDLSGYSDLAIATASFTAAAVSFAVAAPR